MVPRLLNGEDICAAQKHGQACPGMVSVGWVVARAAPPLRVVGLPVAAVARSGKHTGRRPEKASGNKGLAQRAPLTAVEVTNIVKARAGLSLCSR